MGKKHKGRRIIATFALSRKVFDQLFHGRSGYRAQYCLSVEHGRTYNRRLVDALMLAVPRAFSLAKDLKMTWAEIERSLCGPDSKVWPRDDWAMFYPGCKLVDTLRVARWEAWAGGPDANRWGHLAILPPSLATIELKGTFYGDAVRVPPSKDGDRELHERDYT